MPQREVARALDALELRGRHLLVAVSGGLDSVSLLHVLLGLQPRFALELSVGHVDHGLRGAASAADARFVEELARGLGLGFAQEGVEPRALREGGSSRARPTLQEAARQLRYGALRGMADKLGADVVATAHTADDQAETVLLRLLRGCGPDGLGGIPEASPDGRIVRPLLAVTRAELEVYGAGRGVCFREDASNRGDDYARNRLRHHWLPQLGSNFNPRLLRAVGNLAEAQRRDAEWIESIVARELEQRARISADGASVIERAGWGELPEPLARRIVKRLLERAGGGRDVTRTHLLRVLEFLRRGEKATTGATIELPGGLRLSAERVGFVLRREPVSGERGC
jgi:tRNA(Ile)-lysidine synthase